MGNHKNWLYCNLAKFVAPILAFVWILAVVYFANYSWRHWVLNFPPKEQIEILKVVWLPMLILGSSVPLALLFGSQVSRLYELKQSLDSAPERLSKAILRAEEFEDVINKVSADAQNTLVSLSDKFRSDLETSVQQVVDSIPATALGAERELPAPQDIPAPTEAPTVDGNEHEPSRLELRKRILAHVEPAAEALYERIDSWNSDGRRLRTGELIVSKGGGNRVDIAALLAEKNLIIPNCDN